MRSTSSRTLNGFGTKVELEQPDQVALVFDDQHVRRRSHAARCRG
jgi:hypothetical protein